MKSLLNKIFVFFCIFLTGITHIFPVPFVSYTVDAALDPDELEYTVEIGPIAGSTSANYVYGALFNPGGSSRTLVVKKVRVQANAVGTANWVNLTLRRITSSSSGTQITAGDIIKKNTDSSDPVGEVRHTGVSSAFAGTTDSKMLSQAMPGAGGAWHSISEITFGADDEKIILQAGEGIGLYQEAAGDADQRVQLFLEWEEVASAPSAGSEYMLAYPRVENAAGADYKYATFFNPAASGKTAIVKRIMFGAETCDTTAVYTNNQAIRRISAASGGTSITAANVPKKHTGSANTAMEFRYTGVTATLVGGTDARLALVTPCAAASQPQGRQHIYFYPDDEKLILQPGEGIAFISQTAGDSDQLNRLFVEWEEVASGSTPASQGEYMLAFPRVSDSAVAPPINTVFFALMNPAGSGKTALVKKLGIRNDADTTSNSVAYTWRRITAASNGTAIAAADIPKKHTGTANSVMTALYCGTTCATAITATLAGTIDSRILTVNGPTTLAQVWGHRELSFNNNEPLVLQPGEGIAYYIEAAGDIDTYAKAYVEWDEESTTPTTEKEYVMNIGPVNGSTAASYNYATFFNPAGSATTTIIKRIEIRVDANTTALYVPMNVRRISTASAGTQVAVADIPKKHTGSGNSIMEVRRTGVTATYSGSADSDIIGVTTPAAVGSAINPYLSGYKTLVFENDERLILKAGEGIGVYHGSAGDTDFRVKILVEWQEVLNASAPAADNEYTISVGPVAGSLTSGYVYASLLNPPGSAKKYAVKRIGIRADRTSTLVAPGYIPISIRSISDATQGTQIAVADIPKKNTGTANTSAEVRHTNVTPTFTGVADSRLLTQTIPGVVGELGISEQEIIFGDELILGSGEGIALYQEQAAGDTNIQFRLEIEWEESDEAIISISVDDGAIAYGSLPVSGTTTTIQLTDTQTITNNGTVTDIFNIKGLI